MIHVFKNLSAGRNHASTVIKHRNSRAKPGRSLTNIFRLAMAAKFFRLVVTTSLTHSLFLTIWPLTSTSILSRSAISGDRKGFRWI